MSHARLALLVIGVVLLFQSMAVAAMTTPAAAPSVAATVPVCNGKFKGGLKPSPGELSDILKKHAEWLKDGGPDHLDDPKIANDSRRANLCGASLEKAQLKKNADLSDANLRNANLHGAKLPYVNLSGAALNKADLGGTDLSGGTLDGADLSDATMNGAHLKNAKLNRAHLENADLFHAHLENAELFGADLNNASLFEAHLNGADLLAADLRHADLNGAYLAGADLSDVDLANVYLDFDTGSLPKISPGIASAINLQLVKIHDEPAALVKLRKEFKDLGLRTQENQLTYAIRRAELCQKKQQNEQQLQGHFERGLNYVLVQFIGQCNEKVSTEAEPIVFVHSPMERGLNYVLFDLTCQYGMSPGRPLIGVVRMAVVFAVIYVFAQFFPGRRGGIWAVWEKDRVDKKEGGDAPQRLTSGFPSIWPRSWLRRVPEVFMLAAYFSLLSALRIGWSGLNFGTWISRMQPREYALHATGWVRVVSGLQSLISVYLVALTILTYFGTPFEY